MTKYNESLKTIPEYILIALKEFLTDQKRFKMLERQLENTGIMIDKDDYQISVKSVEELKELSDFLNEKYQLHVSA